MTLDEKKAERTRKSTLLQAAKRKRDAEHAIDIRIPNQIPTYSTSAL